MVEIFELVEAVMVATTLSIGVVATGAAVISGSSPPDLSTFVERIQPVYEADDKRIYREDEEPVGTINSPEDTL